MEITHASQLNNAELTAELTRLAAGEREATAALIVHLAEFDARRLYEGAGFPSLFQYCRAVLRLSEDAVYNRIEAARAARRFPIIVDRLLSGSLSLTTVRMLARHLTPANHEDLLTAAAGKGKQEVEALLARHLPQPDVPASVRKLPSAPQGGPAGPAGVPVPALPGVAGGGENAEVAATVAPSGDSMVPSDRPRPVVRPLAPERYEIRFTASAEMREKLRRAQDLLGHAIPSGDIAQVFDRALSLLVADLMRKKCGVTTRPRSSRGQAGRSPDISAAVKRTVWVRDGGRCAFVARRSGRRCDARRFIEFHHVDPRGVGGPSTVANIQLRCRAHNGYEVDLFYGSGVRRTRVDLVQDTHEIQVSVPGRGTRPGTTRGA
jgi:hypothetical protein